MKRWVMAAVAAGAVLAVKLVRDRGGLDFGKWVASIPDEAPPRNISAIRASTERILDLLKHQVSDGPVPRSGVSGAS